MIMNQLMKKPFLIFFFLMLGFTATSQLNFSTYCHPKFGYCLSYPSDLFEIDESGKEYGITIFTNKYSPEKSSFNVVGQWKATLKSINEEYMQALKNCIDMGDGQTLITYVKIEPTYYIISGYIGNDIIYVKSQLKNELCVTISFRYNYQMKAYHDRFINTIVASID